MLTIGQLAAHAGVTIRAVRHYHQRGMLAEPARDASGYRRYGAQAVIDLIRIKTLADAGVPLARIDELVNASPERFATEIGSLDAELERRIGELARQRQRIAELAAGDRLFLPDEVIAILERLRALGFSERIIHIERDLWIMMVALSPDSIPQWVAEKNATFEDADFCRVYRACDEALGWEPSDPRLVKLAADISAWDARRSKDETGGSTATLMNSHVQEISPAWRRLAELLTYSRSSGIDQGPYDHDTPSSMTITP